MTNVVKSIIVIGGGYAGLQAVEELAKNPSNQIKLFDKNPYHYMQTDVYDLIANEGDFADVTVDLYSFCVGFCSSVEFIKEEVVDIDFKTKIVISKDQNYQYDFIVLAVGARTKFFSNIIGLQEYGYGIKALHRAMYFKQKFEMSLFKKLDQGGRYCEPLTIVIAGGGLSGVEIAAQMASFASDFYKNNNFTCRKLNIVLVNSGDEILKGLDKKLVHQSQKHLDKLGVITITNQKVVEITQDKVTLSDGDIIMMDYMIFAGGVEPNGLVHTLDIKKNSMGYIEVDQYLKSTEYEDTFVVGDCATIYENGHPIPPTADVAEQMGVLSAQNINASINKRELKKHSIKSRGILIALGRGYAVGKLFGIYIKGYPAYMVKKLVERVYAYKLERRSKAGCKKIFKD